jgi:hypothetical protein
LAEHLPKADVVGSIDTYIKYQTTKDNHVILTSSRFETSVKKK